MDGYCSQLCQGISDIQPFSAAEVIKFLSPSGQQMSRDSNAINAGLWTPAHIEAYAVALSLISPFEKAEELGLQVKRLAQHLENKHKASIESRGIGINIFIGHGRSQQWRELKDFITERFRLPVDEFNRVPVAGITNIQRLQQMLDQAEFAFLVMTAEDETSEGRLRARQNVIHEVGLIQGRLRFTKAIVLLEEECEDFPTSLALANYDTNEESAAFEQIREVLEREGVLEK
jgi:predicted nucleotide-binding protein